MNNTKESLTNIYNALCEYEEILTERVNIDSAIYKDCLYDDKQRLDDVGHYLDWLYNYINNDIKYE